MEYDAMIIGTGMGGGAVGHALARGGMKVLFLERGLLREQFDPAFAGNYPESFLEQSSLSREEIYRRTGRATYRVNGWSPVLGGGAGGGSAVYGSVLMRFHEDDLKGWPARFSGPALDTYYEQCEELLETRCSQGPFSPWAEDLVAFFRSQGLNPFRTPVGYRNKKDCQQCFGFYCPHDCKKTSFNSFIEALLVRQQAEVLYSTKVTSLRTSNRRVVGVVCETDRGEVEYRALVFSGGWRSRNADSAAELEKRRVSRWRRQRRNDNDLVGRFLMRHLVDFYYLKAPRVPPTDAHLVEVSLADFCHKDGRNWGVINCAPGLMSPEIEYGQQSRWYLPRI